MLAVSTAIIYKSKFAAHSLKLSPFIKFKNKIETIFHFSQILCKNRFFDQIENKIVFQTTKPNKNHPINRSIALSYNSLQSAIEPKSSSSTLQKPEVVLPI